MEKRARDGGHMTGQNSDPGATIISTRSSDLAKLNPKCPMNYSIIFTEITFYPEISGLFQLKTTTRGRSSVQPLSLDGAAQLKWILQNRESMPGKVKACEVREVATSLELFNKVDLQAVIERRRWSSGGTFTSFYLQDLSPQADSIQKPDRL